MLYNYTVNKILQKKSHYEKLSKVGNVSIFWQFEYFYGVSKIWLLEKCEHFFGKMSSI